MIPFSWLVAGIAFYWQKLLMKYPPSKMVSIGHNTPKGRWHIESHHHPYCEMIVVTDGYEDVLVQGRKLRAMIGDVLLFKPEVAHEEWSGVEEPLKTYHLSFRWNGDISDWPLQSVDEYGRIRLLSSWLYAGRDIALPETRAAEDAFFHALVREFLRLRGQQEDPLVASVRRFVRRNIGTPLTVGRLAQQAGMSKFHFIRRYRQLTGRSPMQDVRMIRLAHARDMILTSNLPLKAIAPMAGLGDEISLYRLFRRYLNMTPGQIRRSVRG
jgi:AraC-like DNA-binding protein